MLIQAGCCRYDGTSIFLEKKRPLEDGMRRVINVLFMTEKNVLEVRRAVHKGGGVALCLYFLSGLWADQVDYDSRVVGDKLASGISSNHAYTALPNRLQILFCYSRSWCYFVSQGISGASGCRMLLGRH